MLPEPYQKYAPPGAAPRYGPVELRDDRDPVVYVPDAYGEMVPMRRSQLPTWTPPAAPRDLSPQPLLDPQAQRLLAGGVGVGAAGAGLGFGAGQFFAGVAMMGTSGLAILAGLILAAGSLRGRGSVSIHNEAHTHVEQKWFGRAGVTNQQN
jgi:hypothetical protein